ncbi:ferredoxin--NADP reductase [Algivirga pacifica]|uniref:Phenylacetate-CoA oxygenase/reductase subunit PaaK n=1 Tax=Algivirga pacifica TaxID=1162670 RepID=A0ABP9DCY7_9BACT
MNKTFTLKVKEVVKETPDTITIKFKQPLFKKVKYQPGQFLTLVFDVNGHKERRSYSMSSAPNLDSTIDVTVKRVEGGLISNHINDNLQAGDSVDVMEPMGLFTLTPEKDKSRHVILWGAGSGVTPLMSILKSVLFFESNSTVSLIYGSRQKSDIIFHDQLELLKNKFGERLNVVHCLTQPDAQWGGLTGRIDDVKAVNIMNMLPSVEDSIHYLCGPTGMMEAIEAGLKRLKVRKSNIYKESFVPKHEDASDDIKTQKVKIILDGEEEEFVVNPEQTILDAGLDSGIDIPYSCQSGVCTACRGKCVEGKVEMLSADALSASEIAEGYVLTCQAHPASEDVVIEIG